MAAQASEAAIGGAAQAAPSGPVVTMSDVSLSFGSVKALKDANLVIGRGEKLGLIGHNGAGKSTLMNVLSGVLTPSQGNITVGDQSYTELSARQVHELGIRTVFQELSLCPNLTAVENSLIRQPDLAGWGWRREARQVIAKALDEVFPGHGITIDRQIGDLAIAQRQMVEIAMAFSTAGGVPRLVILDEPTSSLGAQPAQQLMDHLDVAAQAGTATILISHRLKEILQHTDRIVVMVDGKIVGDEPARDMTRQSLVAKMGHLETAPPDRAQSSTEQSVQMFLQSELSAEHPVQIRVGQGEVIGFAGLDGHGQRATLRQIFAQTSQGVGGFEKNAVSYVPGDRQTEGVFPIWSVAENATVRALPDLSVRGLIDLAREKSLAADWISKIGIRTAGPDAMIGTLSGGNQQKVLFARALASQAALILLDDPMRGVDVGTKSDVYELIRAEAVRGRSFIWYSTEVEELRNCDRVYVFREGRVTAELMTDEITEENILKASFQDHISEAEEHV